MQWHEKWQEVFATACGAYSGTGHCPRSLATWLHLRMWEQRDIYKERNHIAILIDNVSGDLFRWPLPRLEPQCRDIDEGDKVNMMGHLFRSIHIFRNINNCIPSYWTPKSSYPYLTQHLRLYSLAWDTWAGAFIFSANPYWRCRCCVQHKHKCRLWPVRWHHSHLLLSKAIIVVGTESHPVTLNLLTGTTEGRQSPCQWKGKGFRGVYTP